MECYRTAIGPKRQRFYALITILFVLTSSSGATAADSINFERILAMEPRRFVDAVKRKQSS